MNCLLTRTSLSLLTLVGLLAGCDSGPQCVVDTHCPIDQRCVDQRCVAVGPADAGVDADATSDSGPRDSGARDTGASDTGPADTGPALVGQVLALSDQVNLGAGPAPRTVVTALFGPADTSCAQSTVGGCTLTECPDTSPPPTDGGVDGGGMDSGLDAGAGDASADASMDSGAPEPAANAGVLVITSSDGATVTLPPSADGTYAPASTATLLWSTPDATVNFMAFGDRVPGFNQMVSAPTTVTLTAPDASAGAPTLSRLMGADLAWSGASAGRVTVLLSQSAPAPSTASASLRCDFDVTVGAATLPAIALSHFEAGPASLSVFTGSSADVPMLDPWQVQVVAVASAALPDGRQATLGVTLE